LEAGKLGRWNAQDAKKKKRPSIPASQHENGQGIMGIDFDLNIGFC
jgi:hypothetical protein